MRQSPVISILCCVVLLEHSCLAKEYSFYPDSVVEMLAGSEEDRGTKLRMYVARWLADETQQHTPTDQPRLPQARLQLVRPLSVHRAGGTTVRPTAICYDERMLLHSVDTGDEVERPGRLSVAWNHLIASGLVPLCSRVPCTDVALVDALRVHTWNQVDELEQYSFTATLCRSKSEIRLSGDVFFTPHTASCARLACGGVVNCTRAVLNQEAANGFALVRPPGHHCLGKPSGFCYLNNVAVAARFAQHWILSHRYQTDVDLASVPYSERPRIAIIDWDVHHGDGTQGVFQDDGSVLFCSVHQHGSKPEHKVLRPPHNTPRSSVQSPSTADAGDVLAALSSEKDATDDHRGGGSQDDAGDDAPISSEGVIVEATGEPPRQRRRREDSSNDAALHLTEVTKEEAETFFAKRGWLRASDSPPSSSPSGSSLESAHGDDSSSAIEDKPKSRLKRTAKFDGDTEGSTVEPLLNDDVSESSDIDAQPFYPGTGLVDEVGEGDGAGRTINVPWPAAGFGDLEYMSVLQHVFLPAVREFAPEVVFVSCGFDCGEGDLLGGMRVTPSGFYAMTQEVLSTVPKCVFVLEGGYNLTTVALSSEAVLRALLESSGVSNLPRSALGATRLQTTLAQVLAAQSPYWSCFKPNSNNLQDTSGVAPR